MKRKFSDLIRTDVKEYYTTTSKRQRMIIPKIRNISEGVKKFVAGRQLYRCKNDGKNVISKLEGYICPQWADKEKQGSFDESGYDIDHIIEKSIGGSDDISNLQALCKSCHSVKTKKFMIKFHND